MDSKRIVPFAAGGGLVVVALIVAWIVFTANGDTESLTASGRIEGRLTSLTAKSAAEVKDILVDEGQLVESGDILAVLDNPTQRARVAAAQGNLDALSERMRGLRIELAALEQQTALRIEQAEVALTEARARVARAAANHAQQKRDLNRYSQLAETNVVSQQRVEDARLKETTALEMLKEAEAVKNRTDKELQLARVQEQFVEAKRAELETVGQQIIQAEAALAEQQSYIEKYTVLSPMRGTILARNIEIGERVNAGAPLFTMVDLDRLYVKVYIPEPDIGKVILGQDAQILVDSYPDQPFIARVSKVAQQAEFTPKNVETREERVKLVFAVELSLAENPGGVLKPGMPADGVIQLPSAGDAAMTP